MDVRVYEEGDRCEVCGFWWWNDGKWHSLLPKQFADTPQLNEHEWRGRWTRCPEHPGDRPTPARDSMRP